MVDLVISCKRIKQHFAMRLECCKRCIYYKGMFWTNRPGTVYLGCVQSGKNARLSIYLARIGRNGFIALSTSYGALGIKRFIEFDSNTAITYIITANKRKRKLNAKPLTKEQKDKLAKMKREYREMNWRIIDGVSEDEMNKLRSYMPSFNTEYND